MTVTVPLPCTAAVVVAGGLVVAGPFPVAAGGCDAVVVVAGGLVVAGPLPAVAGGCDGPAGLVTGVEPLPAELDTPLPELSLDAPGSHAATKASAPSMIPIRRNPRVRITATS
ncbi:hypothetical protein ACQP06_13970 [Nocardia sp. CA-136227]|uniref:hypothetical protein n=1 Tax=Nocardia sp. CA-136227 TaxID=3239979 RepID=UPI003D994D8C